MAPECGTKKRTAEESEGTEKSENEQPEQQPCKKAKLSKKELLEAAKARLREAQEKKKLAEEKKREAEAQPPEPPQDQSFDEYEYEYGYCDDYYYEYHIPPVTGPKDSLLIQNIASTGPAEKVAFIEDNKECIEQVLRVINGRKRETLSPVNAAMPSPWGHQHQPANPQGPPPPQETIASTSSVGSSNHSLKMPPPPRQQLQHNHRNGSNGDHPIHSPPHHHRLGPPPLLNPPPRKTDQVGGERNNPMNGDRNNSMDRERSRDRDSVSSDRSRRDPQSVKDKVPLRDSPQQQPPPRRETIQPPPQQRRDNALPPPPQQQQQQHQSQLRREASSQQPSPNPLQRESPAQQQQQQQAQQQPNKPHATRPWKLALAQVTGKTLDCPVDLPTKASYLIRTQTQGVLAHVQFFSVPDNPALLQHNPSKRHLQDHLTPISKLPCNTSQCWKAQDILSFLQHQDERRTTYQPPARRNLPLSHWAILDFEPPLHLTPDSLGYFTAERPTPGGYHSSNNNNGNGNSNDHNNDKKEISFAGKLVWNMNDFYHNQDSGMRQRNASSKLSKWGEVVSAKATTGIRNSPLIATIQGFYEIPTSGPKPPSMPPALRARKVILPKSRTIGMIIGVNYKLVEAATTEKNNGTNSAPPQQATQTMGCVHVLFPNGVASGPSSVQSLRGARAILYD